MWDSQPQFPKAFGGWQQGQTLLLLLHVYRLHDLGAPHLHLRQGMSFDLATGLATETQYRSSTYPGTEAPFVKPVARTPPDSSSLSIRGVLLCCTECGDA